MQRAAAPKPERSVILEDAVAKGNAILAFVRFLYS
jgi:hypothetical protein